MKRINDKFVCIAGLVIIMLILLSGCNKAIETAAEPTPPPVITVELYGEKENIINFGGKYIDEGVIAQKDGMDVSDAVEVISNLNTNKIGSYTITYSYEGVEATRNIEVIDTEPPVLTLTGDEYVYLPSDIEYEELGFTAVDNYDGDITDKVEIVSSIDASQLGEYTIEYKVSDTSGNSAEINRVVSIVDSPLSYGLEDYTLDGLFIDTIIPETILSEEEIQKYMDETIIIGDSRACCFIWYGFIPSTNVWGNASMHPMNIFEREIIDYSTHEEKLALEFISERKPKRVIFSMGIDCITGYPHDKIIEEYSKLIGLAREASPDTTYIIHNVMPVSVNMDFGSHKSWEPSNRKVNTFNYYLVQMCEEKGIAYLDSHQSVKDNYGHGIKWYFTDDNIHLSKLGQREVYRYVISHPLLEE